MSLAGLRSFIADFVTAIESKGDIGQLRSKEYNLEPHTFYFTPNKLYLSTLEAHSLGGYSQQGWKLTKADRAKIKKLAEKHGKKIVTDVKKLGGTKWYTGVKYIFNASTDVQLRPYKRFKYQYQKALDDGDMALIAANPHWMPQEGSNYDKIRAVYEDHMLLYFKGMQDYFSSTGSFAGGKQKRDGTRRDIAKGFQKLGQGLAGNMSKGRATDPAQVFELSHAEGEGVLETQMGRLFDSTFKLHSRNMDALGLTDIKALNKALANYGFELTIIRSGDGEGFSVALGAKGRNQADKNKIMASFDKDGEKAKFLAFCHDFLTDTSIADIDGSDSIRVKNRKLIIEDIARPFRGRKNVKVKTEYTKIQVSKGSVSEDVGAGIRLKAATTNWGAGKKPAVRRQKRRPKAPRMALHNILGIINERLPDQVAGNMGAPGLENRTGRFAQSVRATDVVNTPQGYPSIGYTYRKNPYSVYESSSGSKYSDPHRDPRGVIDKSIREIAMGLGLGQLYTRRQ